MLIYLFKLDKAPKSYDIMHKKVHKVEPYELYRLYKLYILTPARSGTTPSPSKQDRTSRWLPES